MTERKSIMRIIHDIMDLINDPIDGIEIKMNKENIYKQICLIIGPKDTPYFGGYYFFDIEFPNDYPKNPPKLKMITNDGNVRFNPNLYENGKVCLSILGTWSGPSWSPIMTLKTILLSIQSLMNDFPIINEPGYETTERNSELNINYNCYINYHNIRIAFLEIINKKRKYKNYYDIYSDEIIKYFRLNYNLIYQNLQSFKIIYASGSFGKIIYFLKNKNNYNFIDLLDNFELSIKKIIKKNKILFNDNLNTEKK